VSAAARHLTGHLELGGQEPGGGWLSDADLAVTARRNRLGEGPSMPARPASPPTTCWWKKRCGPPDQRLEAEFLRDLWPGCRSFAPIWPGIVNRASSKRSRPCWRGQQRVRSCAGGQRRSREPAASHPDTASLSMQAGRPAGYGSRRTVQGLLYCQSCLECLSPAGRGDRPLSNDAPKPLALYLFSQSRRLGDPVGRTSSGGVSSTTWWMQVGVPELPFGGVARQAGHGQTTTAKPADPSFPTPSQRAQTPLRFDSPFR